MTEPLLSVRDVFCVHRTPEGDVAALQGATLDVEPGRLVCVLGPSGAGKSTLLRVMAGLQIPAAGTVMLAGRDIGRLGERDRAALRRRQIGFVTQSPAAVLAPELTASEIVALPLALRGSDRAEQRRRAGELLAATGLADRAGALPRELSGGERQRLALCAAIAHRPALLLADEPTAELDAAAADSVRTAIAAVVADTGTAAVVVSHDPATSRIASRTVLISDGRIAGDGPDGARTLVVGRGGWIRLPESLVAEAGIGSHVRAHARGGEVVLSPAGGQPLGTGAAPERTPASTAPGDGSGAASDGGRPPRRPAVAIEDRDLEARFGASTVLAGLSFAFAPARLTTVTGPSGSGKTTLLRLLVGLARAERGDVVLDGEELGGLSEEARAALMRARIGYLPQDPEPLGFLSAAENIELALALRGWARTAASAQARAAIAAVGLAERGRQRVERMSAGEAQRVALARALAGAGGLLVVDEPTSRLDREHAAVVAEMLAGAAARGGQTVICATHDPELIERADAVLALGAA